MNEMNYLINEEYSALKIKYRLVPFYGERELYAAECFQKEIVKSGKREEALRQDKTLLKEHFQTLQVLVEEIKHGKLWKIFDLIREVEK